MTSGTSSRSFGTACVARHHPRENHRHDDSVAFGYRMAPTNRSFAMRLRESTKRLPGPRCLRGRDPTRSVPHQWKLQQAEDSSAANAADNDSVMADAPANPQSTPAPAFRGIKVTDMRPTTWRSSASPQWFRFRCETR